MDKFLVKKRKVCVTPSTGTSSTGAEPQTRNGDEHLIASRNSQNSHSSSEEDETITKSLKTIKVYKHKFRDSWTDKFKWVEHKNDQTICKVCSQTIVGSVSHLKRHDASAAHKKNFKSATTTPSVKSIFIKEPAETSTEEYVKQAELKLVMFLAEHNLAFRLMDHLPQLVSSVCPDSKIGKKIHLKRKKATQLTTAVLGPANKQNLVLDLQKNYFSIIIDETTDISTTKCLAIVVRYCQNGCVYDRFFDLIEMESSTAQCLFDNIKQTFECSKIPVMNIIGLGADNCSVMMGHIKGVKALFQEVNPHIVIIGCTCHSFHLCSSYAFEKLPKSIEQFSRDIYNYFSNSSKRCLELRECEIFATERPQVMLKPSQTRWLSLQNVINRILDHWASLELFFTRASLEDNVQSAGAILNALRNPIYKIYFYFLSYVLDIINKLNLEFQSESPKIHVLLSRVTSLYKLILRSFLKKSYLNVTDIDKVIVSNPDKYLPLEQIYCGARVEEIIGKKEVNSEEIKNFKVRVLDFYIELTKQIKKRFNFSHDVLKFANKFDPKVALSGDINSISETSKLFPYLSLNVENLDLEYRLLCETDELKKYDCNNVTEFWSQVCSIKNSLNESMFPSVTKIAKVILSLPHSSAAAERIFSQMNLIKSKTRNKLLVKTCGALLHTKDMLRIENKKCFQWVPGPSMLKYTRARIEIEEVLEEDIVDE